MEQQLMTTQALIDNGIIPMSIADKILVECRTCKSPIIRDTELRGARCGNFYCPTHMKMRAAYMCKRFGLKGYGPETCADIMDRNGLYVHYQLIPYIMENKPKMLLWEIADIADIEGFSGKLEDMLAGYASFERYFAENPYSPIIAWKKYLTDCAQYFVIKPPLAKNSIMVMLHGPIRGYQNRDDFIPQCNDIVGDRVRIKQVGKNQSADYLVTENVHDRSTKTDMAKSHGIPVVSPAEFIQILAELYAQEKTGE